MNARFKHLDLIQGVIGRLAADSFLMKRWSIAIAVALFVLLSRALLSGSTPVAFIPILIFWGLDGYCLWQQRLFRALYDHVRVLEEEEIDFAMDVDRFRRQRTWLGATFSSTLVGFYGAVILMVGIAASVA
ncbi:MAG: hypothetical protein OXC19_21280 [Bryobacterales bacterium]|nr:hypothetical protein [Bryobacterales bacterium]